MKRITLLAMLAGLLAVGTGCALIVVGAAAAGVGTYVYVKGEVKSTESVTLEKTYEATLAALSDLKIPVTSKSKDGMTAKLVAHDTNDTPVTIHLEKLYQASTEVRIRVGKFGDEARSQVILQAIRKRL